MGSREREEAVLIGLMFLGIVIPAALARIAYLLLRPPDPEVVDEDGTERVSASLELPWNCQQVWDLVYPAENAPLLGTRTRRGWRVEGTPAGVGEQQATEDEAGRTHVLEVEVHEPPHRAVTRVLSPELSQPVRHTWDLEPTPGGCRLTVGIVRQPRPWLTMWLEHRSLRALLADVDEAMQNRGSEGPSRAP